MKVNITKKLAGVLTGASVGISYLITRLPREEQQTEAAPDTRYISDQDRQYILKKYGYRCARCGSPSNLELDHIIPLSRGGATSVRNLQVLCRSCNRKKGIE